MRRRRSLGSRFAVQLASIILLALPAAAWGGGVSGHASWAALGGGISPARYGADRNGSLVGTVAIGRALTHRTAIVARFSYARFRAHDATVLAPLSVAIRAHLSTAPDLEGGPYVEVGPVICRGTWRSGGRSKSAALLGATVGIGTEVRVSSRSSLDWGFAGVLTTDAHDLWPDRLTRDRAREGMARGLMYLGLILTR